MAKATEQIKSNTIRYDASGNEINEINELDMFPKVIRIAVTQNMQRIDTDVKNEIVQKGTLESGFLDITINKTALKGDSTSGNEMNRWERSPEGCPYCDGIGYTDDGRRCEDCHGTGYNL